MKKSERKLSGLVLAGGDGARLQDLTRALTGAPIPKQYCRIFGDCSLLETTLARIAPLITRERTFVVLNARHQAMASGQLRHVPKKNLIIQPANRDTGPGVSFSLLHLASRGVAGPLAVFPSDHFFSETAVLLAHVERGVRLLEQYPDKLVLLGIRPDRPDPGYGYIKPGAPLSLANGAAFRVGRFWEKPSPARAAGIVRRGGLWNSFIMVFSPRRVLELLKRIRPADLRLLRHRTASADSLARAYQTLVPWNFSSDFLAHIPQHLLTIAVDDVAWSDLGTPQAVERTLAMLRRPRHRHSRPVRTAA